ncbi:MAG TPA: hypothetical protein ENK75_06525, partial [Saprospiraceae bacterium]|nr:hypothetical protein [Saprospiraceae bacterium]
MKSLQRLCIFYLESNIHVSIAAGVFIVISCYNYNNSFGVTYALFTFFSTLFSYNFIRLFEGKVTYNKVSLPVLKNQSWYVPLVMLLSLIGMVYFIPFFDINELRILIPAFLLTFGYVFPVLRWKGQWVTFRDYPNLKVISVALTWAIVGVLFPLYRYLDDPVVWIQFIQRFFLIFVLVIPFDIRDLQSDAQKLNTLPQWIGVGKSIKIGLLMLLLYVALDLVLLRYSSHFFISDVFVTLLSFLFLVNTKPNQS